MRNSQLEKFDRKIDFFKSILEARNFFPANFDSLEEKSKNNLSTFGAIQLKAEIKWRDRVFFSPTQRILHNLTQLRLKVICSGTSDAAAVVVVAVYVVSVVVVAVYAVSVVVVAVFAVSVGVVAADVVGVVVYAVSVVVVAVFAVSVGVVAADVVGAAAIQ